MLWWQIKYKLKESVKLSDESLTDHVCPGIQQCSGMSVAAILAMPLLWACVDEVWCDYVPNGLRSRILNQLSEEEAALNMSLEGNLVDRVLCVVSV